MLYLFRVISDEEKEFFRDVLIDESDTFLDFHRVLQENLGYDPTQITSFFVTSQDWEKIREITLIDMQIDTDYPVDIMEQATLGMYIIDEHQRMLYVYDFFSERAFFIELMESFDKKSQKKTPFISSGNGKPPCQLLFPVADEDIKSLSEDFIDIDPDEFNLNNFDEEFPDSENLDDF